MPTQTANPIPTQLNIAPRGKRWKDWQLVDGEIGFPTREAMEKYHCHPERVQALEEERLALLESNRQLNQLNDRQAAQIKELEAQLAAVQQPSAHPDDIAVDALAAAMKAKLAKQRAKGYGGWDTDCTQERLSELLRGHVDKGDPVDVANFCAFLHTRGEGIAAVQQGVQPWDYPFFSHDTEGGTEFHKTEAEAIKWCEEALQVHREEACDGWAEEVESLTWGVVLGRAVKCDEKPAPKGSEFDHLCDYSLQSVAHPTQQGLDAQRWQIVHDHISGEYIAGRACFVVHVQPMSGANIMRGSVAEHFTKAVDDIAAQIKIAAQAKQEETK